MLAMQSKSGAFKNVLGTMRTIPVLIGAVHYDVMDLVCPKKGKNVFNCKKKKINNNKNEIK